MRDLDFHPPIPSSVGVEKSKKKVGKAVGVAMRRGERGGGGGYYCPMVLEEEEERSSLSKECGHKRKTSRLTPLSPLKPYGKMASRLSDLTGFPSVFTTSLLRNCIPRKLRRRKKERNAILFRNRHL